MSYSVGRYLAEIGKTLASPAFAAAGNGSMAHQLTLTIARMSAQLAVDQEFGRSIQQQLAAQYLASAIAMLPELDALETGREAAAAIRGWQRDALPSIAELESVIGKAAVMLCAGSRSAGTALVNDLVEHELHARRTVADLCRNMLAQGAASGNAESAQRFTKAQLDELAAFLKQACGFPDDTEVVEVIQLPGGFSKQTYFMRLSSHGELPEEIVIRYDPADSVFGITVDREFGILNVLHERGMRVPRPYALEMSGKVLGAPFMVTARAVGGSIGDSHQVDGGNATFGRSLARELATMHAVPIDAFSSGLYGADVDTVERLRNEIDQFHQLWQQSGCTSIAMECAFHWLRQNVHLAAGRRALIHRDVGCHNLIVLNDEVSALVDWEAASIGNPAQDLGYCLKSIVQFMPWDDFMAAYRAAGGFVPRQEEITFYDLWGRVWIGVYAAQARHMFRSGVTDNIQLAYIGEHVFRRDLECIATALSRIRL